MDVEVGSLRLEILVTQLPPPLQYDIMPRRSAAAGKGLDEPGVPHADYAEQEEMFLFQVGVDRFLHVDCISEQEGTISFQADVGVNPEIPTVQLATRQEFARPPKNRQQKVVTGWSAKQKNV